MGFNDQEIVALSGAHNLGRCHSDRSWFEGAWVNNPTQFSNQYFRLLLSLQWKKKTMTNGIQQFVNYDQDTETELMMLPTDIALTQDSSFIKWVELYARDKDRFFEDFSNAFEKLVELGIQRDENGAVTYTDNEKGDIMPCQRRWRLRGAQQRVLTTSMGQVRANLKSSGCGCRI